MPKHLVPLLLIPAEVLLLSWQCNCTYSDIASRREFRVYKGHL